MDDESAMIAVRDHNDAGLFSEIMTRWKDRVSMYCYQLTRSWEVSEDISQDVFLRLYEKRASYMPSASFSTFIWRITSNLCNDFFRRQKTEHTANIELGRVNIDSMEDPSVTLQRKESAGQVEIAIGRLTHLQREVIILKHFQNLKLREIAEVLDVPLGTIASRLADALDRLTKLLKPS